MMKRFIYIITGLLFSLSSIFAQNEIDALRYSQYFPSGTARSIGMGGAIGAVGGDFTGLSINPAGIGLYRQSELSFSPNLSWTNSSSDFLGNSFEDVKYNFNFGNLGMVFNNNMGESGWVSTSFGIGYNRLNSFNKTVYMSGVNNNSSLLDNFVDYANGNLPSNLNDYYEGIAFDSYAIDTINSTTYFNDFNLDGYGQKQSREVKTKGSVGEYAFSFGANYNHRLYLGATLGIQSVSFEENVIHTESDPNDIIYYMDNFSFYDNLRTSGIGYTFKIGAIARPIDFLRVGVAYHLPTFYYLRDKYSTRIEANFDSEDSDLGFQEALSPLGDFKYQLRTPSRLILSATGTIGKMGMISADYEFVDYTKANLDANDYRFEDENSAIDAIYRAAHNLRLGGELRLGPAYLRAGYALYASPYATEEPNLNANNRILTAGFGIRSKYSFMDISFSNNNNQSRYYMYVPQMTDGSLNTLDANSIQMTLGFRF
jgi:hypothetical protein